MRLLTTTLSTKVLNPQPFNRGMEFRVGVQPLSLLLQGCMHEGRKWLVNSAPVALSSTAATATTATSATTAHTSNQYK